MMLRGMMLAASFLALAGCAGSPRGAAARPPTSFEGATRLVDQGRHAEALPVLRCVARQGEGFEIAQYLAGHSALILSRDASTAPILRDDLRVEGFDRLVSAGEAGWPAAQAELAEAFSTIETDTARLEAGYWAAVYRANSREQAYGLDRLDNAIEAHIDAALSDEERAAIRARVARFTPTPLVRQDMIPACADHVRSGMPRGDGEGQRRRPQGGRGGPGGGRPSGPG